MMRTAEKTTDVIIIGSGMAGVAAAQEAARVGARVTVLEKMDYTGGNSALAGGGYACWTSSLHLRERLGLGEDSAQSHARDTLASGGGESRPELVRTLCENAPAGLDWLVQNGVEFKEVLVQLGGHSAPRSYQAKTPGKRVMELLRRRAEELGAEIITSCRVAQLLTENGRVCGVNYKMGGDTGVLRASRGVIIASGGFSADIRLRTEYCPELTAECGCSNHRGATGEVLLSAHEIGAALTGMKYIQLYPCANPAVGSVDRWAFYCYSAAGLGAIYTDGAGRRFVNESLGRDEVSAAQLRGCEKPTWTVFAAEIAEALGMTEREISTGLRLGRMRQGKTAAELADAMGAEGETLAETLDGVNAAVSRAERDGIGREYQPTFRKIARPQFYAIAQWPSVHYTMGGLVIDTEARVLNGSGAPLPGLFAAGEVCGGIHGKNRLGGNALAECAVFGRIAGKNAALLKNSIDNNARIIYNT